MEEIHYFVISTHVQPVFIITMIMFYVKINCLIRFFTCILLKCLLYQMFVDRIIYFLQRFFLIRQACF